eukprot:233336-Rhodomonas_salina.2
MKEKARQQHDRTKVSQAKSAVLDKWEAKIGYVHPALRVFHLEDEHAAGSGYGVTLGESVGKETVLCEYAGVVKRGRDIEGRSYDLVEQLELDKLMCFQHSHQDKALVVGQLSKYSSPGRATLRPPDRCRPIGSAHMDKCLDLLSCSACACEDVRECAY